MIKKFCFHCLILMLFMPVFAVSADESCVITNIENIDTINIQYECHWNFTENFDYTIKKESEKWYFIHYINIHKIFSDTTGGMCDADYIDVTVNYLNGDKQQFSLDASGLYLGSDDNGRRGRVFSLIDYNSLL